MNEVLSSKQVTSGLRRRERLEQAERRRSLGCSGPHGSLPSWSARALDAEGTFNGKTWRDMPGGSPITRVCNWWLYRRGLFHLEEERAEARALADFARHQRGEPEATDETQLVPTMEGGGRPNYDLY